LDLYREKYIKLKSAYENSYKFDPFFDFRTELENSPDKEAKYVLVDVYMLMQQYRKAYNLMVSLGMPDNQKTRKNLAVIKNLAQKYGDSFEKKRLSRPGLDGRLKKIPVFKYHPDPFMTGAFYELDKAETCSCCGKPTFIRYKGPFYSLEEPGCLCPDCIANGMAAEKFDGEFQDECSVDEIDNPEGLEELIHKTPGYCGWQQEYWRAHCNDYCAFIGYAGSQELKEMGIMEEVLDDSLWNETAKDNIRNNMFNGSGMQGYLFRCLHCGRYLLWADCD